MQATSGKALRDKSRQFVECPETKNVYLMRRPLMSDLINANVLPENFVSQTLVNLGRETPQKDTSLTDKDLLEGEASQRALITASMLEPRIVEQAEADDEIEYRDLPASDREHLFAWCTGRLPALEVPTEGGQSTTVEALEKFSSERPREESAGTGNHVETQRNEPEQIASVAG
jgi:hypothetical protein